VVLAAAAVLCRPAFAPVSPTPPGRNLYEQEGTDADGYLPVNAAGKGPAGDSSDKWTNWKYQYGSASWSAVYSAGEGWVEAQSSGEMRLRIEADIEAYATGTFSLSRQEASRADVGGVLVSNAPQYVGISLAAEGGAQIPVAARGPVSLALSTDAGPWRWPELYAPPAAGPGGQTAWWLVKRGSAGSFALQWRVFLGGTHGAKPASPVAPTIVVASAL